MRWLSKLVSGLKGKQKPPAILYKFFGQERLDVISTSRVRFSQVAALNDPFEFATTVGPGSLMPASRRLAKRHSSPFALMGAGFRKAPSQLWRDPRFSKLHIVFRCALTLLVLALIPLLCLAIFPFARRHALLALEAAAADAEELLSKVRDGLFLIFSTSEKWDSVPMWAHYSNNHRGFAIGFDSSKVFTGHFSNGTPKPLTAKKVNYSNKTPSLRPGTFDVDDFLTSKMSHWKYEHEWRFLALPDEAISRGSYVNDVEILLFDFDPASIKEIIFGASCDDAFMLAALKAATERKLIFEAFKIMKDTGYGFRRVPLSQYLSDRAGLSEFPASVPSLDSVRFGRFETALDRMTSEAQQNPFLGGSKSANDK